MSRVYTASTRSTAAGFIRQVDLVYKHIKNGNLMFHLPALEAMDIRMRNDAQIVNRCNQMVIHIEDVLYVKYFYDERYNGQYTVAQYKRPLRWGIGVFLSDKDAIATVQRALSVGFNAYIVSGRDNAVLLHDRRQSAYNLIS